MKVEQIDLFHVDLRNTSPKHQLFLLQIITDEGITGAGEIAMPYGVGGETVLAAAKAVGERFILGANAEHPERLWQNIFRSSYWTMGHATALYGAMSGFDIALWDIKGKTVGKPIWYLLGGRVREQLPLYANHWYGNAQSPEEFAEQAQKAVAQGWRGLKFDPFRQHAGRTQSAVLQLDSASARKGIAKAQAVRLAVGSEVQLYFDLHGALSAADAIRWGSALAELAPEFVEEPTDTLHYGASLQIGKALPHLPLAGGERLYLRQHFIPYLEHRIFHTIQPDVCLAGGITETRKIATMAEAYQTLVQLHNCAGPVCSAATVQLMAATANAVVQEWFPFWEDGRYAIVTDPIEMKASNSTLDIALHASQPGLGVQLNMEYLRRWHVETLRC
ncbi:MAG: mandelate racemase/muconate lactonizing enzyme family protein [Cytophagales bacterium]|nr:mandelate racemase/muconate lactonizing enzyme family protein [Bernardetiaceae bacterium]MDW8203846.1 mandelate racemase/muconate lactonizing enzyme family protein [Cytophagales bacterium]